MRVSRPLFALLLAVVPLLGLSGAAMAAPKDYRFELVGLPVKSGKATHVTVRLIHVPDGKPVVGAEITEIKFDMGPAGMAGMSAPAKSMPSMEAGTGTYMIETQPSMVGNWGLNLTAKVKGEAEPVRGTVVVAVPK
ncbi:MAG: FixH family protein [Rhodospirillaceae bacterium]|nr:FixH family protein [Rhodospirillaceae bacterium]